MNNKIYHLVAERTKTIRVEIDRVKYLPESLSKTETDTHVVEMGLNIGKVLEEEIIDKILNCTLNVSEYFERNKVLQTMRIFISGDLIYDFDRNRK
jgi:hypothetical protein